jgi:hypothetical protein
MSTEVKKPWTVLLMALWSFFGIGSFLSSAARVVSGDNVELMQGLTLAALALSITLIYFLSRFNKKALIIFSSLSILLALQQLFGVGKVLLSENPSNPIIYLHLYFIIPSLILSKLALSSDYLSRTEGYAKYLAQDASRKQMLKAMKR